MIERHGLEPLEFTITTARLIYSPAARKVLRFEPPRLVVDCPMCEWSSNWPDTPGGLVLAENARHVHGTTVHPEAITAGGMVMPPTARVRGAGIVTRSRAAVPS